jgi:hypothetical protein
LKFAGGPQLLAYDIVSDTPAACGLLALALQWTGGQAGDTALVQLLDPFGRVVIANEARSWEEGDTQVDIRTLQLAGSLPGGRYGLRILVRAADGQERLPITDDGVTIPTDQIPPLPLVIHPYLDIEAAQDSTSLSASFENGINLTGVQVATDQLAAGDWLRFSLIWQTAQPLEGEWTVFTQLLGPDGQVWGQRDHQPGGGWYGTPLWQPGRPVVDHYAFQIQPDAPPGLYRLIVGLYQSDTQARARLQGGADFVEAATIQISASGE